MEPALLRFMSQLAGSLLSVFVVLNSIQCFHPVRIGAKRACFFLACVPANPNVFSVNEQSNIMSLLSRLWIQEPTFVLRAKENSTINFQECLGTWVRHCLAVAPSEMASHSSSSESQSFLMLWRVLMLGKVRVRSNPSKSVVLDCCKVGDRMIFGVFGEDID